MIKGMVKPFGSQSFLVGLGVAAAAYFFGPQIKEALKPIAVKGTQGLMMLSDKTKSMINPEARMSAMVEVGQDNNIGVAQMNFYEKLIGELKDQRQQSNQVMEEMKNTLLSLKEEIASLKNMPQNVQEGSQ